MRRARVYRKLDAWVVLLIQPPDAHRWTVVASGEYWFDEWADALAWAVRMVGA